MNAAHQLVHTLTFGDAISTEVFALQRCFRSMGFASEIYAINIDPKYKGMACDYRGLCEDFDGRLVLHYSLGSPLNDLFMRLCRARRGLIYHNLTPAHWFKGVNPRIVSDIQRGLQELPRLCENSDFLIADSAFNAGELSALGFKSEVLELPVDPDRWNINTNSGIYSLLKAEPALHLLHVGRMAPNKCIEDIIRIFHFVRLLCGVKSRLWLVGSDIDTELYSFALKRLVRELDLVDSVNFVGRMADCELKALYQTASVYLCMSEHEGFCCPLIEAMHFGLPVVAFASSALPDTLGCGGMLVREKRHVEIALLIKRIHDDESLRNQLIEAGRLRATELSFSRFDRQVRAIFSAPLQEPHRSLRGAEYAV